MRGIKVSQMTEIPYDNISNDDYLYVVDVDQNNPTRKVTLGNLFRKMGQSTGEDGKTIIRDGTKLSVNIDGETLKYDSVKNKLYADSRTTQDITPNITVGNLAEGVTIEAGATLDSVLRQMLIAYISPAFNSFTCTKFNTDVVEVGATVDLSGGSCNWSYNRSDASERIKSGSIGVKLDNEVVAQNLSGNSTACTIGTLRKTLTSPGSSILTVKGIDTKEVDFSRSITKQWKYKYFSGHNNLTDINSLTITTGTSGWGPSNSTTLTINASATDRMVWFAYPTSVITNTPKIIQTTSLNADVSATFSSVNKSYTLPNNTSINYTVKYFIFPEAPGKTETYSITL